MRRSLLSALLVSLCLQVAHGGEAKPEVSRECPCRTESQDHGRDSSEDKDQALSLSSSEQVGCADWTLGTSSVLSSGLAGITSFRRLAAAFSAAAHQRWLSGS